MSRAVVDKKEGTVICSSIYIHVSMWCYISTK